VAFRDDALHYTFAYPSDYVAQDTSAKPTNQPDRVIACTTSSLAAIRRAGKLFDMAMIVTLDLECAKEKMAAKELPSFAKAMVAQSLSRHGSVQLSEATSFKMDGYDAVFVAADVDESNKQAGQELHDGTVCALVLKHAVCWQMLSYNSETLQTLLNLPITFDGHTSHALHPSDTKK
jgi:hypothetical protein